jgi:hypothetical protein
MTGGIFRPPNDSAFRTSMIPLKIKPSSLRLGPTWYAKMRLDLSPFFNMDVLKGQLALAYYFFESG